MSAPDIDSRLTPPRMALAAASCSVFSYLSVCSGIEAATTAWHSLGWRPLAFSEIEKFPSAVLAHHWPDVPNLGDMTKHNDWPNSLRPNLIVGGTPCQAFSVAGLRKGLADPRGNLTLVFLALLAQFSPQWVVWENVPGVRSSDDGRALGSLLGGLEELGYGWAYRTIDAQYANLAQRRERVFVVGCLGDWRRAGAVLFERESMFGNPPPRREAGKVIAPTLDVRAGRSGETTFHTSGGLVPSISPAVTSKWAKGSGGPSGDECQNLVACQDIAPTLSARTKGGGGLGTDFDCDGGLIAHTLRGEGFDASEDGTGRGTPLTVVHGTQGPCTDNHLAFALGRNNGQENAIAFNMHKSGNEASSLGISEDRTDCSRAFDKSPFAVMTPGCAVRRLTPTECERLQGFPDGHTLIPWRGKMAADGPRYKALGNSMAVPVMRWIGERILKLNSIIERL